MNVDLELERWKAEWQAEADVPADLREKAKRQLRHMRWMVLGDISVTVVMGGLASWGLASGEPAVRMLAAWVWTSIIVAWLFRWFNDRGNWSGAAPNTEVFLELLIRRYRSTLRNIRFGYVLGVVQLVVSSGWVYFELNRRSPTTVWEFVTLKATLIAWVCVAAFFGAAKLFEGKVKKELSSAELLRNAWVSADGDRPITVNVRRTPAPNFLVEAIEEFVTFPDWLDGMTFRRRKKARKT